MGSHPAVRLANGMQHLDAGYSFSLSSIDLDFVAGRLSLRWRVVRRLSSIRKIKFMMFVGRDQQRSTV